MRLGVVSVTVQTEGATQLALSLLALRFGIMTSAHLVVQLLIAVFLEGRGTGRSEITNSGHHCQVRSKGRVIMKDLTTSERRDAPSRQRALDTRTWSPQTHRSHLDMYEHSGSSH